MKRLILFLIRRRLGLKKYQLFRFANQRSKTVTYYFTSTCIVKNEYLVVKGSNVSLNWLLNDKCEIEKLKEDALLYE